MAIINTVTSIYCFMNSMSGVYNQRIESFYGSNKWSLEMVWLELKSYRFIETGQCGIFFPFAYHGTGVEHPREE